MVRLCHGLSCQGCSLDVPRGGFFCGWPHFGEGKRPARLAASSFPPNQGLFLADGDPQAAHSLLLLPEEEEEELGPHRAGAQPFPGGLQVRGCSLLPLPRCRAALRLLQPPGAGVFSPLQDLVSPPQPPKTPPRARSMEGRLRVCWGSRGEAGLTCSRVSPAPAIPLHHFGSPRSCTPSTTLPLGTLPAFVYLDWNFWGCLHRRDLERILLVPGRWSPRMEQGGSPPTAIPNPKAPWQAGVLGKRGVRAERKP